MVNLKDNSEKNYWEVQYWHSDYQVLQPCWLY